MHSHSVSAFGSQLFDEPAKLFSRGTKENLLKRIRLPFRSEDDDMAEQGGGYAKPIFADQQIRGGLGLIVREWRHI